ncbi:MAG TPA: sigma-70 family RNA polymerase sigma factor [Vicinamibacterales bacterium]|nr:sigma-70 family RNA polymerase sigma factor [Vicinamibacterales bacterium]
MSRAGSATGRQADERDDPKLVAAFRAGDLTAFEKIVREHGRGLLAVARRLLRNDDDAREAVQDAFVSAFRSCRRFEGSSRISTWLHRIVVNSCLMRLRTQRRSVEVPIDDWLPRFLPDGHHEASFIDWSNAAHALIEQQETCALVRRCIDQLPDSYRTVLLMHDIEGISVDEVAAALDVSSNAVHIRLHRARQALRTLLDPVFLRGEAS